jgi:copper ion binding protein
MTTSTYQVKGMTCDHCVQAVTKEISKLDGVTDIDIDLASGQVTVASEQALSDDAVREAVDEAGYEVTS